MENSPDQPDSTNVDKASQAYWRQGPLIDYSHGGRVDQAAEVYQRPMDSFIDYSSNLNVFLPAIEEEAWARWRRGVERYPDPRAEDLRIRLAHLHGISEEHVLPTAGAIDGLYLAARLFQGAKVAIIEPGFGDYNRAFVAGGANVTRVVGDAGNLSDEFDATILGNPNNPNGLFYPRSQFSGVQTPLVVDEAFIEFVPGGDEESLLKDVANNPSLIVLRSLTKSWRIPGLRLGFVATSNCAWMEQLRMMQPPWSIGSVTIAWACEYLNPKRYLEVMESLRDLPRIREDFQEQLRKIPGIRVHPSTANFFLVELEDAVLDSSNLFHRMALGGYLVRVCDSFYGLRTGGFLRLAVRTDEENTKFAEVFAKAVEAERRSR